MERNVRAGRGRGKGRGDFGASEGTSRESKGQGRISRREGEKRRAWEVKCEGRVEVKAGFGQREG